MKMNRGSLMKTFLLLLLTLVFPVLGFAHQIPEGAVPFEKSETCASCHPVIYNEWKQSMHAKSSAHVDKAHGAVHKKFVGAMKKAGKTGNYHCGNCHTPMAENVEDLISGKAQLNSKEWKEVEGIGCAFCHRIESIIQKERFNSYTINKDGAYVVYSPSKSAPPSGILEKIKNLWNRITSKKTPHNVSQSNLFAEGEVCMGCHSHMINPKGAAICVMREEGGGDCLACHMDQSDGAPSISSTKTTHSSHLMPGGHNIEMLRQTVMLDARIESRKGERLIVIDVTNVIAHVFPSTNPMRIAFIKVTAKDNQGNIVWSNFKDSPMEDKKSLFFKAFKAGDNVGVPAWAAESVAFDTRLKSGENRSIAYTVPIKDIKKVSVVLVYKLFPPKAIEMMGIPKDGINDKSYIVAKKEVSL